VPGGWRESAATIATLAGGSAREVVAVEFVALTGTQPDGLHQLAIGVELELVGGAIVFGGTRRHA
jgi:hypothetical protein